MEIRAKGELFMETGDIEKYEIQRGGWSSDEAQRPYGMSSEEY
jgi:hypothetical protein